MTIDLTEGPVTSNLRRQALPFGLGLVAIFSFEAVDLFFIGQLGDAPLAAIGFTLPVIWLLYGIGIGFEAGAAWPNLASGSLHTSGWVNTSDPARLFQKISLRIALTPDHTNQQVTHP